MSLKILGNNISNVNFTSKNNNDVMNDPRVLASSFVNMSDNQIKQIAYITSFDKKHEKRSKQAIVSSLYAMPVVDSIARGILARSSTDAPASLSGRIGATGRSGATWAGALLLLGGYNAVKNKLAKKSESYRNFEKSNPLGSLVLDLGAFVALLTAGTIGASKLKTIVSEKFNILDKASQLKEKFAERIDGGKLNTKFLPKITKAVEGFAEKHSVIADLSKGAIRNSIWIVFVAGLLSSANHAKKNRVNVENRYAELKKAQFETAKHLSNVLGVENDTLAKGSPVADELKSELNETLS